MSHSVADYHGDGADAAYRASRPVMGWLGFVASAGGERDLVAPASLGPDRAERRVARPGCGLPRSVDGPTSRDVAAPPAHAGDDRGRRLPRRVRATGLLARAVRARVLVPRHRIWPAVALFRPGRAHPRDHAARAARPRARATGAQPEPGRGPWHRPGRWCSHPPPTWVGSPWCTSASASSPAPTPPCRACSWASGRVSRTGASPSTSPPPCLVASALVIGAPWCWVDGRDPRRPRRLLPVHELPGVVGVARVRAGRHPHPVAGAGGPAAGSGPVDRSTGPGLRRRSHPPRHVPEGVGDRLETWPGGRRGRLRPHRGGVGWPRCSWSWRSPCCSSAATSPV